MNVNLIKTRLWQWGILKADTCPICKSRTMAHGFHDSDYGLNYTCTREKCKFNEGT